MKNLTDEEKEMLAEVEVGDILKMPGRKSDGYSDEVARRTAILKSLVYKDLINFSIKEGFYGYLFFSRQLTSGERI